MNLDGWQTDSDEVFDLAGTPIQPLAGPSGEEWITVVETSGRPVHVRAWKMMVGRVPVYLLDTNLEVNAPEDRALMNKLYAGGPQLRIRQEWILGVGGVRVLRAVGIDPAVWHANEGHAAFMFVERLREQVAGGATFEDAVSAVRARSVFTTHTPVPAGHDFFALDELEQRVGPGMGVTRHRPRAVLRAGCSCPATRTNFHMTVCAVRLAARVNGVSRPHGQVSRHLWRSLWPDRRWEAVPIGHVTNGVHLPDVDGRRDPGAALGAPRPAMDRAYRRPRDVGPGAVARPRQALAGAPATSRHILRDFIREDARHRFAGQLKEAAAVVGAGALFDPDVLTIGFARRFATYKRANLIFSDIDRLRRLCTNPDRPVQVIFAGKAHPADTPGKEVLQSVYRYTRDPSFEGRIAFVEDYDMHIAHLLVQGVDAWLNLPRVPLEASGTSGMKAALNGVPQLSTLDGWWQEGYDGLGGWAIPTGSDGSSSDAQDAESLLPPARGAGSAALLHARQPRHSARVGGADAACLAARRAALHRPADAGRLCTGVLSASVPRRSRGRCPTHGLNSGGLVAADAGPPIAAPPSCTFRRSTSPTRAPAAWPRR